MALRRREMGWIARINLALAEDRFVLYHQTYLSLNPAQGAGNHLEVLIRMIDEAGELVQPGSFLPAAERYNLMPAIDRWVDGVCRRRRCSNAVRSVEQKAFNRRRPPFQKH